MRRGRRPTSQNFPEVNQCSGAADSPQGPSALRGTQWKAGELGLGGCSGWRPAGCPSLLPPDRESLGSSGGGLLSYVSLAQAAHPGKKLEDSPVPIYYFGRKEATSAEMVVEAAFRCLF